MASKEARIKAILKKYRIKPSQKRKDPQGIPVLRKNFDREWVRRINIVKAAIYDKIVTQDALGLAPRLTPVQQLAALFRNTEWATLNPAEKLTAFEDWLQGLIDQNILATEDRWMEPYITTAHMRGVRSAETATNAGMLGRSLAYDNKTLEQVRTLYNRAFTYLRGFTQAMGTTLSGILAQGLAEGKNPRALVKDMVDKIDGMTRTRAIVIARTELARAYAEGQLDGFERSGRDEVKLFAEWSTAGDDRVCPKCLPMEGQVMTISEARGLIPLHQLCRCAWIPVPPEFMTERQERRLSAKAREEL